MISSTSRRHLLRSEKHLLGFSATSELPSSPPRHGQHQLRQRKAHVLRQKRRKRPRPPGSPKGPQKCARVRDQTHSQRRSASRRLAEYRRKHVRSLSPHGALGGFALATATFVASTPTTTSGVGRLGDGGRGATRRRGKAVSVEESVPNVVGIGRSLRCAGGLRSRG